MRPADVDRIASAIANGLAGADPDLLGCGSISSSTEYTFDDSLCGDCLLECNYQTGGYECGGAAAFNCSDPAAGFECGPGGFACPTSPAGGFNCTIYFGCEGPAGNYAL